jgi:hypothetical protein
MPKQKELSSGAKYALTGTIISAVIGLITTLLTLGYNYLQNQTNRHETQTAVARLTQPILTPSLTPELGPSSTPSFTYTASPTLSPSFTPTPTSTQPVGGLQYCIIAGSVNVRTGPGIDYPVINTITFPACPYFDGRNDDGSWLRLTASQADYLMMGNGWINATLLTRPDSQQPPVVPVPPTPYPTITPAG